ncbi:MAG TPA: hypothetical protein VN743_10320 [Blastocatellia bacterium]|nr:hypothetical protein [Blastocatellia bacterium]
MICLFTSVLQKSLIMKLKRDMLKSTSLFLTNLPRCRPAIESYYYVVFGV